MVFEVTMWARPQIIFINVWIRLLALFILVPTFSSGILIFWADYYHYNGNNKQYKGPTILLLGGGGGYGWFQEKNNLAMKYPGKKYLSRHIMWEKKILRSCMLGETFHLQSFWKIILTLTKSPLPPQKSKGQLLNKHSHSNFFSSGDNQYSVYQIHHGNWGNDHWM